MRDSKIEQLVVVKRNGKKVEFDGKKIALAIKKGFDSINNNLEDNEEQIYSEKDIQKVYLAVMNRIEKEYETAMKIIHSSLLKKVYQTDINGITELGYILDNANKLVKRD